MDITVNLDGEFEEIVQSHSMLQNRSVPQQIEHWAKIGQVVEDNPEPKL
ncbi:TA system antitoxin ParD family protein [Wolbachia endosymbiont (group A) of Ennomos erosarius]